MEGAGLPDTVSSMGPAWQHKKSPSTSALLLVSRTQRGQSPSSSHSSSRYT